MPEMETHLGDRGIISQLWGKGKGEDWDFEAVQHC